MKLAKELESGQYTVVLRVSDTQGLEQDSTVQAVVCDCAGEEVQCQDRIVAASNLPLILGILAAILLLLSKCPSSSMGNDLWRTLKRIQEFPAAPDVDRDEVPRNRKQFNPITR